MRFHQLQGFTDDWDERILLPAVDGPRCLLLLNLLDLLLLVLDLSSQGQNSALKGREGAGDEADPES